MGSLASAGPLSQQSQRALKHAGIAHRVTIHGLRRTATDLPRRAAVDPVAAKAMIGHTTDRMREHYSSMSSDKAPDLGERVLAVVVPGLKT